MLVMASALERVLLGLLAVSASAAPLEGPCDIYARGQTPCVAAHSLTRALYGAYTGALYQVQRASDNATRDIPVLAGAGIADSEVQDAFCKGDDCTVLRIYDQSPNKNLGSQQPVICGYALLILSYFGILQPLFFRLLGFQGTTSTLRLLVAPPRCSTRE